MQLFANGRPVNFPKCLSSAITEVYTRYQQDCTPGAILFLDTSRKNGSSHTVDVNVVPNKMEIIIEGEKEIARQVRDQLETFLSTVMPTKMTEVCSRQEEIKLTTESRKRFIPNQHSTDSIVSNKNVPNFSESMTTIRDKNKAVDESFSNKMNRSEFGVPSGLGTINKLIQPVRDFRDISDSNVNSEGHKRLFEFPSAPKAFLLHPQKERILPKTISMKTSGEMDNTPVVPTIMQKPNPENSGFKVYEYAPGCSVDFQQKSKIPEIADSPQFTPKMIDIHIPEADPVPAKLESPEAACVISSDIHNLCEGNVSMAGVELQSQLNKVDFKNLEVIGQFNMGFIICKLNKEIYIVDQHAADEKYNYETFASTTIIQSQPLIKPLEIRLQNNVELYFSLVISKYKNNK